MNINERLNQYVAERGIKQIYISKKTGLSRDIVSKILKNDRRLMADEFLDICFALDVDPRLFGKTA